MFWAGGSVSEQASGYGGYITSHGSYISGPGPRKQWTMPVLCERRNCSRDEAGAGEGRLGPRVAPQIGAEEPRPKAEEV